MHAWRACVAVSGIILAGSLGISPGADESGGMNIASPTFAQGQPMPRESAMRAENESPMLIVSSVPPGAKTLVLIVDDPDAPAGLWTHWLVWNIPAGTSAIGRAQVPRGAVEGKNSFGNVRYDGPAPPSGTHRYFFHVYGLDTKLPLIRGASRDDLEAAMKGHVVGSAEFFGTYSANP
jgi:Raf kinase inhibitor-like YbhB/YbcL family protein